MKICSIKFYLSLKVMNHYLRIKEKNEIEQLLLKYKHGNDVHEHGKQQDEWNT